MLDARRKVRVLQRTRLRVFPDGKIRRFRRAWKRVRKRAGLS